MSQIVDFWAELECNECIHALQELLWFMSRPNNVEVKSFSSQVPQARQTVDNKHHRSEEKQPLLVPRAGLIST